MSNRTAPWLLAALLAGCASTADSAAARDYTLHPGETITLADRATLTYTGVTQDSRCPPDVQCIHAGNARVLLRIGEMDDARDVAMPASTLGQPRQSGRWRVTLLRLAHGPAPAATLRVEHATR